MLWSKAILLASAISLFSTAVYAEKITCPEVLKDSGKIYRMNMVSVFEGKPEKLVDLMPDTDDNMIWTLKQSQQNVKAQHTAMYLVCRYKGTDKTATLKIPASAKQCTAWFGDNKNQFYAACE
ncbi:STY0301 family protein [Kosakonia sp.]|uniref:STY0301 family protein n=1 Tax=Kosakonia sp. TaxID=1916651 RepID=UPI002896AE2A|nr:STY0301 family protein [Kosakonia sp.]